MTISYNWLKDYIKTSLTAEEIAAVLTATGLEVEAVEKIEDILSGLKDTIIGKVLDASTKVGKESEKYLSIQEDYTLEIGLTPNRTDAISHYGVARDLVAALRNMKGMKADDASLVKPSVADFKEGKDNSTITVLVENNEACPRYSSIEIKNIKVEASPKWLQKRLVTIGLRPINNIVDITNYVQHELGQPLHAFDTKEISGDKVVVRLANEGEKIKTLDEVERELTANDLVICDNEKPMCIAGVFGGINGSVTEKTTNVFLESAYLNPVFVRKTARRQGLNTDSSFRFERGCDPNMTITALKRAAQLMVEIAGGEIATSVNDIYPNKIANQQINFRWEKAFTLIGKKLEKDVVKNILHDLEIEIASENEEALQLSIPLYRTDVMREADVVEEVLRIYGYDNIESPQGMKISLQTAQNPNVEALQNKVSDYLTSNGFAEMMSMSLTKSKYLELVNEVGDGKETVVELLNPLSGDLAIMRQNLLYSGLEAIAYNHNHRQPDLRLYEFGKVYHKFGNKYNEEKRLALFLTGHKQVESWNNSNDDVSFTDLKSAFENLLKSLRVECSNYQAYESPKFNDALECAVGKTVIARLGSVNGSLLKAFDVKQTVWYAEIFWENILKVLPKADVKYKEVENFPAVRRDLSLLIDKDVKYADIERLAMESEKRLLRSVNLFDVYEGKNLEDGKKSYAVSFILQDSTKTMTNEQSDQVMIRIQKALEEKLGASLRG